MNVESSRQRDGLWRMLLSDPGYENTFAESIDQTIFSETKTDHLGIVDHFSGTIGNDETASDNRLFVRARYCRKCKAYVDRFDHHCPKDQQDSAVGYFTVIQRPKDSFFSMPSHMELSTVNQLCNVKSFNAHNLLIVPYSIKYESYLKDAAGFQSINYRD